MPNAAADISASIEELTALLTPEQLKRFAAPAGTLDPKVISFRPGRRPGLSLADLDRAQRSAVRRLLSRLLSDAGFQRICAVMSMEDVISRRSGWTKDQQREDYWVALVDAASRRHLRIEGHHVSLSVTLGDGDEISVLPYCLGAYPAKTLSRGVTVWHPLAAREAVALELARGEPMSLSGRPPADILRHESGCADPEFGIAVSAMSEPSRRKVDELIDVYLQDFADDLREAIRGRMDLAELRFGWAGPVDLAADHYYALAGPELSIEYINQRHREDAPNHQHTIIRSPRLDFGNAFAEN